MKIKNFQDIEEYKKKFEDGKITEKDIPEPYRMRIRRSYIQQIQEYRSILHH